MYITNEKFNEDFLAKENVVKTNMSPDQLIEFEFFILMKDAFDKLPRLSESLVISPSEVYQYICENEGFEKLKEFLDAHDLSAESNEFLECFYNVKQECIGKQLKGLDSLIGEANAIAGQSNHLAQNLQKHKETKEVGLE